jgi:hypothetical protein
MTMMPAQPILYAATMFLALASLLRWKYRREFPYYRLRRGLQTYAVRVLSELTAGGSLSGASLKTA